MEKTLKEQAKIVEQRLYYHFGNSNGGFNVPKQLPFMKEFFAEIVMLVAMAKSYDELGNCNMPRVNGCAFAVDDKVRKGNNFGVVTRISDKAVHVQYSNGLFEKFHFNPRHHMQTHINLLEHCR